MRSANRDYDNRHRVERKRWQAVINQQTVNCARCHKPIEQGSTNWDLGHADDRRFYTGPEHVNCNRKAGGSNGAQKTNRKRRATIRAW
jgi:hypothetical protein